MKDQLPTVLSSPFPPSIVQLASGRYLVGGDGWYKVDSSFTLQDARKLWTRKTAEPPPSTAARSTFRALSSNGKKHYDVVLANGRWSCSCPGFEFHRRCKHIDSIKLEVQ